MTRTGRKNKMIKYTGMILIAVSCTAGGFMFSDKIRLRLKQTESFLRFFDYIIKHIDIYKYPVEKIFTDYSDSDGGCLKSCGFLDRLLKNGRINGVFTNPWGISLDECRNEKSIFLKGEEYETIKEFGSKLGTSRADEQIYHMNIYRDKLNKLYEEEFAKEINQSKLYKISGGLLGIFLCVLMF